jgi:hypothetical protein
MIDWGLMRPTFTEGFENWLLSKEAALLSSLEKGYADGEEKRDPLV